LGGEKNATEMEQDSIEGFLHLRMEVPCSECRGESGSDGQLVNDPGNPWVKISDPYPYLSKPVPVRYRYRFISLRR